MTRVALAPDGVRRWIGDAIAAGGGQLSDPAVAEVLVWAETAHPKELDDLLSGPGRGLKWVQLPWAGIEPYVDVVKAHSDRTWTCAKGVYAGPVAEHALMLLLAGLRGLGTYARATSWQPPQGDNLFNAKVAILGGGGITERLLPLLAPFDAHVTVVRKRPAHQGEVGLDKLHDALDGALGVVLALALTPETTGIIGRRELDLTRENSWVVNVARGRHIVTDDLVEFLRDRPTSGAALDVTDPEPLPEDHPLWSMPNCIITPHVGNTPEMAVPLLAERISTNIRRWSAGEPLLGLVDPALGY